MGGKNKEQTNNMAGVSSKCKKRSHVTLHSLCICRLTLAWISSEISTKLLEMPTQLDRSSLTAAGPYLIRLVSLLSGVDSICHSPSPVANCLLSVPSSNSSRVPLPTSGHVEDRGLKPLFGFAPKQTKGSSALRTTYIVLQEHLGGYSAWF